MVESSCQEISEIKVKETTEFKEEKNIHELRKVLKFTFTFQDDYNYNNFY